MSKQEARTARRRAEKTTAFMEKVDKWVKLVPAFEKRYVYHALLVCASGQIPLPRQGEVIQRAQDLYYEIRQEGR